MSGRSWKAALSFARIVAPFIRSRIRGPPRVITIQQNVWSVYGLWSGGPRQPRFPSSSLFTDLKTPSRADVEIVDYLEPLRLACGSVSFARLADYLLSFAARSPCARPNVSVTRIDKTVARKSRVINVLV